MGVGGRGAEGVWEGGVREVKVEGGCGREGCGRGAGG